MPVLSASSSSSLSPLSLPSWSVPRSSSSLVLWEPDSEPEPSSVPSSESPDPSSSPSSSENSSSWPDPEVIEAFSSSSWAASPRSSEARRGSSSPPVGLSLPEASWLSLSFAQNRIPPFGSACVSRVFAFVSLEFCCVSHQKNLSYWPF